MIRRYLQCDICSSKWDITNTDLGDQYEPGSIYFEHKVRDGVRAFNIQTVELKSDDRIYRNNLDICDECYNKLDRFIFELAKGEENPEGGGEDESK